MLIGSLDDFTLSEAREEADGLRGDVARGKDPHAEKRAANASSLGLFLEKEYGPWVTANRQTGAETLRRLAATFGEFDPLPLKDITLARVERWRTGRLLAGIKPSTVNRDLASLRSVLSRAVDFGVLREHPLSKLKASRVDERGVVRYLTPDEERQLRQALAARDDKRRVARESANEWRTIRGYELLPVFGTYTDHVTPLVLLALNTGLRRGELFHLRWRDVDLPRALVTARGDGTKSGQTRVVNLNREAVTVMTAWMPADVLPDVHVFAGKEGKRDDVKTAWLRLVKDAKIEPFRFHDLRHTFASKLAMAGVDLNTIRELLGHADLKMTLRYAHLAPAVKAAAVERLLSA